MAVFAALRRRGRPPATPHPSGAGDWDDL